VTEISIDSVETLHFRDASGGALPPDDDLELVSGFITPALQYACECGPRENHLVFLVLNGVAYQRMVAEGSGYRAERVPLVPFDEGRRYNYAFCECSLGVARLGRKALSLAFADSTSWTAAAEPVAFCAGTGLAFEMCQADRRLGRIVVVRGKEAVVCIFVVWGKKAGTVLVRQWVSDVVPIGFLKGARRPLCAIRDFCGSGRIGPL
jgi:hypothetical protein